jgi:hypothetical protein
MSAVYTLSIIRTHQFLHTFQSRGFRGFGPRFPTRTLRYTTESQFLHTFQAPCFPVFPPCFRPIQSVC